MKRSGVPLVAFAFAFVVACRAREAPKAAAANPYETKLQPLIEDFLRKQEIPGFAIAVIDDGKVVYEKGFGVQSLKGKDPTTPRSLFHMASITKPFVATAVMQLVEKGRMSLDAPITTYLPYFEIADPRAKTITVRQMLTHTSGMPDVDDYEWDRPQYDDGALERYVRSLKDQKLVFAPGERMQYSNMAYEILGDAVAKASGMTFEEYVRQNILQPLGMSDSTLLVKDTDPALMTWGHELDGKGHPFASLVYPYNRTHTPSSDLHSNVRDMSRWAIANLDGGPARRAAHPREGHARKDVDPRARARRAGPGRAPPGHRPELVSRKHRGHDIVSHGGGDTGYITDLVMIPEGRKAVVWMANVDYIGQRPVTRAALDTVLGLTPEPIVSKRSAGRVLTATYKDGGLDAALKQYADLKRNQTDLYDLGEDELNTLGYFLLREKKNDEALRVFRMNAEAFPKSANAQDSLGEALEIAGDKAGAREAYERALKLDPQFPHARDALGKLRP